MTIRNTTLKGCYVLAPQIFQDERGYFFEVFNQKEFRDLTGQNTLFVQDNQSLSSYGTIRGLHFQKGEFAQAKLLRVVSGRAFDVAVDLRESSPTFRQWFGIELSSNNNLQLYIPRGFAHGFSALENNTIISYKCDNFFNKASESGVNCKDPGLKIDWQIPEADQILSRRDKSLPFL